MKTLCVLMLAALAVGCGSYHTPTATAAAPKITTLSPASTTAGGPQFMLTVNGSGFAANSTVYFSTIAEPTTFVSGTQLTATVPASGIVMTGTKAVYVVTPGGGYGSSQTSNTVNFTAN